MFGLSRRSRDALSKVHPDLKRVVERAMETSTSIDFTVLQGLRTIDEQKEALASGHSTTMHSRHLPNASGLACAVDVGVYVNGGVVWEPITLYVALSQVFKQAAKDLGVPIEWGGDWESFKDWGHYQLPWAEYP
jgi:peptidoglycan L-alanyl-D-glutamate endopeptidase CwlK